MRKKNHEVAADVVLDILHANPNEIDWGTSPNGKEIVIIPKDIPLMDTEIAPGYMHLKCAACEHDFWSFNSYQGQPIFCPKCNFPLRPIYAPR